jgi:hypothetical protein
VSQLIWLKAFAAEQLRGLFLFKTNGEHA